MGSRYLVSGVQLGIIMGVCKSHNKGKNLKPIEDTVEEIQGHQYVGYSERDLTTDVCVVKDRANLND